MQVVEIHSRECIVGRVKIWRRIYHVLIADICSRIACVVCSTTTRVSSKLLYRYSRTQKDSDLLIATGVPASVRDYRQSSVHGHQLDDEVAQRCADIVSVDCDIMVRRIRSHVLVHNSKNFYVALDVVLHNSTSAQESAFFAGVEVEFEGIFWSILGRRQDTKRLKYSDNSL